MSQRPELCVGAVVVSDGALLLVRRANPPGVGRWSLPGGRVEAGEPLAQAVVREVAEETGLSVLCGPLVGWVERFADDHHFVILDFEAYALDELEPVAGDDASDARWVPIDELDAYPLVDGLLEFLDAETDLSTPGYRLLGADRGSSADPNIAAT